MGSSGTQFSDGTIDAQTGPNLGQKSSKISLFRLFMHNITVDRPLYPYDTSTLTRACLMVWSTGCRWLVYGHEENDLLHFFNVIHAYPLGILQQYSNALADDTVVVYITYTIHPYNMIIISAFVLTIEVSTYDRFNFSVTENFIFRL